MSPRRDTVDPVKDELRRRLEAAVADARSALGMSEPHGTHPGEDDVAELIAAVEEQLAAVAPGGKWRSDSQAHAAQLERVAARHEARSTAIGKVHRALAGLREITDPGTILTRAPKELVLCSELERVVVSLVRDGRMVAETAHFSDDPVGALKVVEELAADPPRLEYPLIENEIVRRSRATIVTDVQVHQRVHRPMARTMGWHNFVAAPISVRGEVIGLIHADTGSGGRALDVLDADVLWTFAAGLGDVYETAVLRRTLRRQQSELREFVEWLAACSSELNAASVEFAPDQRSPSEPPGEREVVGSPGDVDDRLVFENVLTRRELEVLRLMVRGETNSAIADELVISEGTVKFHVSNILAKLRVANRAEAVSRYHRLVRLGAQEGT